VSPKGTLKYHMTLWEGVWPNRHIIFIMAKKAYFTVYFTVFTI